MKAESINAAGRQIEARYVPGRDGYPVLVFLHEGLGSIDLWKRFPQDLARLTGCPALVYSRYGNGFSQPLEESRSVSYMHDEAAALPAVLAAFDVDDAVLVGHSDGASIALIYAAGRPDGLRGIIAEAPHTFVEDLSVRSIAQARTAYENGGLRERLARYHADAGRTFYGWNDIWLHPEFRSWDIRPLVASITVPMLLVQGAQDEYGTLEQVESIRRGAAQARVDTLLLAECGHAPHRDRRELTLQVLAAFVKSVL